MRYNINPDCSQRKTHGLDALRGLAATGVVITHAVYIHPLDVDFYHWGAAYFSMGVPLFFILSAICMSLAYSDGVGDGGTFRYAIRRYLRIAPLFYFMLAAWLYIGIQAEPLAILQNITFTFGFVSENQVSLVPAGWSIGVEMIFYLIFPALTYWRGLMPALLLLAIAFLTAYLVNDVLPFKNQDYYYWTHFATNAPYFALGFIVYEVYRSVPVDRFRAYGLTSLLIGIGMLIAAYYFGPLLTPELTKSEQVPMVLIASWGAGFAFLALSQLLYPVWLLVNVATMFLGKINYSLYLVHPFIIYVTFVTPWAAALAPSKILVVPIVSLFVLAIAIPIATISYHIIEQPFIRVGRRLTHRTQNNAATS